MSDYPGTLIAFEVTVDCADAAALAGFWKTAVGYVDAGEPGEPVRGVAWLTDPRGIAPHLCLVEVPERKSVKNRMHIDLVVSGDATAAQKWQRITDEVARLGKAGATVRSEFAGNWISMADPEGNEFDVC